MTENKRYVRILDYSEKEVRIFDEHNQKNIFNIFFEGLDSAICLKGALEDTVDLLNELHEENQDLKEQVGNDYNEANSLTVKIAELTEENKELQKRNDRQAERLDDLYNLIEQKDWKALTGIIEDFHKTEEQLQKEMECYRMTEKRLSSNDIRNKVELEDIIGIVKTDEPTNSVELKKELSE